MREAHKIPYLVLQILLWQPAKKLLQSEQEGSNSNWSVTTRSERIIIFRTTFIFLHPLTIKTAKRYDLRIVCALSRRRNESVGPSCSLFIYYLFLKGPFFLFPPLIVWSFSLILRPPGCIEVYNTMECGTRRRGGFLPKGGRPKIEFESFYLKCIRSLVLFDSIL